MRAWFKFLCWSYAVAVAYGRFRLRALPCSLMRISPESRSDADHNNTDWSAGSLGVSRSSEYKHEVDQEEADQRSSKKCTFVW